MSRAVCVLLLPLFLAALVLTLPFAVLGLLLCGINEVWTPPCRRH